MVRIFWVLMALVAVSAGRVEAKTDMRPFLSFGTATDIPAGLAEMCRSQPEVCDTMAGDQPSFRTAATGFAQSSALQSDDLDRERLRLLKRVGGTVNAHVRQQSDRAIYGVGELWRASGLGRNAVGDCEDLAIEKRLTLLRAGFPPERLFFAIVYRTDLGLHTVLVARLDAGDVVLDSRSSFVEPWQETRYQWLIAEQPGAPKQWNRVS